MENLLSHAGIFFTMAAVLTFEAILLRLASEPEGGREVKARKGESHLGAFIRENWYWLLYQNPAPEPLGLVYQA